MQAAMSLPPSSTTATTKLPLRSKALRRASGSVLDGQRETISQAGAFLRQIDDRVAKAAGMTAVEARTLRAVDAVGLSRGITAVGWLCGVLQPAATASVRRLEGRGFVWRVPREGGRTAHAALTLTQKGRVKFDALKRFEAIAFGAALEEMGKNEREELVARLRVLSAAGLAGVERALAKVHSS